MSKEKINKPLANKDIEKFCSMIKNKDPFCFVRYSDGEMEIIRNRYLKIEGGRTYFKGKISKNNFTEIDSKEFDPKRDNCIREDLLKSAVVRMPFYYKGLPHKRFKKDRDLVLTIHGGLDEYITFADLLINSNYYFFRKKIIPLFGEYEDIFVVANYRSKPIDILKKSNHIKIPDNLFSNYKSIKREILNNLLKVPSGSLILSSASSLSNIIGCQLFRKRNDITFIDVGTAINDLLSLKSITRSYHETYFSKGFKPLLRKLRPSFYIRW